MGIEYYKTKTDLWLLHYWFYWNFDPPEEKDFILDELLNRGYDKKVLRVD